MSATRQKKTYSLQKQDQLSFAAQLVLKHIIEDQHQYSILLAGEDLCLREILDFLHWEGQVEIAEKTGFYLPTKKGRASMRKLNQKWTEYLSVFDLYHSVDLRATDPLERFAMARYFDPQFADPDNGEAMWKNFVTDERWEDMRVAVAEFKGMNPIEVVFMAFMKEGRFGETGDGWEFKLMTGEIWSEMLEVCNSNLGCEELGYENVTSKQVIEDIIRQGTKLMFELLAQQREIENMNREVLDEANAAVVEEITTTTTVIEEPVSFWVDDFVVYYDPWYDPFWISPIWIDPFW